MPDLDARLVGALADRYRLERQLGRAAWPRASRRGRPASPGCRRHVMRPELGAASEVSASFVSSSVLAEQIALLAHNYLSAFAGHGAFRPDARQIGIAIFSWRWSQQRPVISCALQQHADSNCAPR